MVSICVKSGGGYELVNSRNGSHIDIRPLQEDYHDNPLFDAENFFGNVIGVSKRLDDKAEIVTIWADSRTRR